MNRGVIEQMRRQIETQAEVIRVLRAAIDPDHPLPPEWNLTRREGQVFVLLVRREWQSAEVLHGAIYVASGMEDVLPTVIQSHVCHMRRKLRSFGITIEAKRNLGYRLVDRGRFQHFVKAAA